MTSQHLWQLIQLKNEDPHKSFFFGGGIWVIKILEGEIGTMGEWFEFEEGRRWGVIAWSYDDWERS